MKKLYTEKISNEEFQEVILIYFMWKEINKKIKSLPHTRRIINMPEIISESLGCYLLNFEIITKGSGDAFDPITKQIIEFKSTSNYNRDVSSFSPKCTFDQLYFLRFNTKQDFVEIYNLNLSYKEFSNLQVSHSQKIGEQQQEKRRPRLSLINTIIQP